MVDSIGAKAVTSQDRLVVPTTPVAKPASAEARPSEAGAKQLELTALAFDYGKAAPTNTKRVDEVRQAVRNGTYPIFPETIADRMLALKLYWNPNK